MYRSAISRVILGSSQHVRHLAPNEESEIDINRGLCGRYLQDDRRNLVEFTGLNRVH